MSNLNPTLEESKQDIHRHLFQLDISNLDLRDGVNSLIDEAPCGILINDLEGRNLYMNKFSMNFLGFSVEELRELGNMYTRTIIYDEAEINRIMTLIKQFHERQDMDQIMGFFQRLKPKGKDDYEWVYVASRLIAADKRLLIACPVKLMGDMSNKMNRVLDENIYMRKYFKQFAGLTKREKEIIVEVVSGMSSVRIAEKLFISKHTVEQHRKNINNKLGLNSLYELIKFAEVFDLI
ncbi:MAG: helix-turn-helix domain-containing protein [Bacteroidota bacterium]